MKIVIAGTGYVGLVTGACLSEIGIDVVCVDVDGAKIDALNSGHVPIFEPGLEEIVHRNVKKNRLKFSACLEEAIDGAEVVFIAVGTPPEEDGGADLTHVLKVARDCGRYMQSYLLVVTKSTVPVGTSEKVRSAIMEEIANRGLEIDFDVASNPEFLKQGAAVEDFLKPDRIVTGVDSQRAEDIMKRLYKPFTLNGHPIILMDIASAEMTKYAANSLLATKISFMNDIANLCELTGADINMVRRGICSDPRIGSKFIYPGIGYGGSCFPKDVKALINTAGKYGYDLRLLKAVEAINDDQRLKFFNKIMNVFSGSIAAKTVAVWGLSFKPQTNDMREAPSVTIINRLLEAGARVKAYDPVAKNEAVKYFGNSVTYCDDMYEALCEADCLALITEWPEFGFPKFDLLKSLLKKPLVFDGRNIYDAGEMKKLGFTYHCIGISDSN
ncbi:MAG: UDP-glucose/GDP-mannose dehydrogenase family protein [Bacteroidales bacterium]|jgi:UDPglucose 6-dehydrogenase|nr:UDP-glucose/GDP-mannose dehydrogenase family protein [Bacteroidales bacterium]